MNGCCRPPLPAAQDCPRTVEELDKGTTEIMSAPTQVGGSGDGDTEIGAALPLGESGPDL
jgi:hypothetical protein